MTLRRCIALFGPPGVGKTTYARLRDGLDLESIPHEYRHGFNSLALCEALNAYSPSRVVSTADTKPEDYDPSLFTRVLLLPPREKYVQRREERDALVPHKQGQGDYYHSFARAANRYDLVMEDDLSVRPSELIEERRRSGDADWQIAGVTFDPVTRSVISVRTRDGRVLAGAILRPYLYIAAAVIIASAANVPLPQPPRYADGLPGAVLRRDTSALVTVVAAHRAQERQ